MNTEQAVFIAALIEQEASLTKFIGDVENKREHLLRTVCDKFPDDDAVKVITGRYKKKNNVQECAEELPEELEELPQELVPPPAIIREHKSNYPAIIPGMGVVNHEYYTQEQLDVEWVKQLYKKVKQKCHPDKQGQQKRKKRKKYAYVWDLSGRAYKMKDWATVVFCFAYVSHLDGVVVEDKVIDILAVFQQNILGVAQSVHRHPYMAALFLSDMGQQEAAEQNFLAFLYTLPAVKAVLGEF